MKNYQVRIEVPFVYDVEASNEGLAEDKAFELLEDEMPEVNTRAVTEVVVTAD